MQLGEESNDVVRRLWGGGYQRWEEGGQGEEAEGAQFSID